ncbi:MAG: DUF4870 domain-containing protein [Deltaproteobacteria bacterium]|nr:MAG: DUF4870 domain-containing protein [Deltaproteobacteria bacterium]
MTFGGETTSEERTLALVAHLLVFIAPVLGPLVIYLIKKDTSRFVAYHALQATVFQLIAWIIGGATCGIGFLLVVLSILAAIKANKGEWEEPYPLIGSIGR